MEYVASKAISLSESYLSRGAIKWLEDSAEKMLKQSVIFLCYVCALVFPPIFKSFYILLLSVGEKSTLIYPLTLWT